MTAATLYLSDNEEVDFEQMGRTLHIEYEQD